MSGVRWHLWKRVVRAGACALALGACASAGGAGGTAPRDTTAQLGPGQYLNPVIDADFPDPAITHAADGYYYAYATQTSGVRIQISRSRDLVSWSFVGDALPVKPAWASESQNFWAPDVELRDGKYVMYFAAQIDAARRLSTGDGFCIGMASASDPAGPFVDAGHPVVCGPGATTIDPMGFDDPQTGKRLLYWGSSGIPITVQELAPDRASFLPGSTPTALVAPRAGTDPAAYDTGLIEGPWVTFRAPYYYLFFSGNNCCGGAAHYAVMVARSSSATGPFEVLRSGNAAAPILAAAGKWNAPGHNSVIRDSAGVDWMLYHAIDNRNPFLLPGRTDISRRVLLLDRITYVDGWPIVGNNGAPTSTPQTRPAVP